MSEREYTIITVLYMRIMKIFSLKIFINLEEIYLRIMSWKKDKYLIK